MEQLGVVKPRKREAGSKIDEAEDESVSQQGPGTREEEDIGTVQWGGSGGLGSAVDMDQQEAILSRLFKPHKVR